MNIKTLLQAFTMDELNEISIEITRIRKETYGAVASIYPLTLEEFNLYSHGKHVQAISSFRNRNQLGLLQSKIIVEINHAKQLIVT